MSYVTQFTQAQKKYANHDAVDIPASNCASVGELSSYIKQNFDTDTSRIRAIYVWVANNISYDVVRMQKSMANAQIPPQTVADVLKSRTAICQGYAELFAILCRNVGINALVVTGYVKSGGKIISMAHAWVAAKLNEEWFLFDPTWSSGHLTDNQFVKQFNYTYYKQNPIDFITTHMPFDPLYQFLSYPISNREFIDGSGAGRKFLFNYKDSLLQFNKLSSAEQLAGWLRRMEGAGIENDLLHETRKYLKTNLQSYLANNASEDAGKLFSRANGLIIEYFAEKNRQFSFITDDDLLNKLDSMKHYISFARSIVSQEKTQNEEHQRIKTNNLANMDKYWAQLLLEEQFIKKYIATDKTLRRQLFYRM